MKGKINRYKVLDYILKRQIDRDVKNGYILYDGKPLKCHICNSTNLEEYDKYYEEYLLVEYGVRCKDCGQKLGYWAYGYWEL